MKNKDIQHQHSNNYKTMKRKPKITKEMCLKTDEILKKKHLRLKNHIVILKNDNGFGTAVLIKYKKKEYFLTAAHVVLKIKNDFGIVLKPDEFSRNILTCNLDFFKIKFWDPNFKKKDLQNNPFTCKDLALIEIPDFLKGTINAAKEYVVLSENPLQDLNLSSNYFGLGLIEQEKAFQLPILGIVLHKKKEIENLDYYVARAQRETIYSKMMNQPGIKNFRGYSGGGLFLCNNKKVQLAGIAYCQDPKPLSKKGYVEIIFHGPKAIQSFLERVA